MKEDDFEPILLAEGKFGEKVLRLYEKRWRGEKALDVRLWWYSEKKGEWFPSRQGLQMTAENWKSVLAFMNDACL